MSFLLDKSSQNERSALMLWDIHRFYAPSVHCAYYSCIQLMIHVLLTNGGYTAITMDAEIKSKKYGNTSHTFYIKKVTELIAGINRSKCNTFNKIWSLKDFRNKSDYQDIEITNDDANKATSLSVEINALLRNIFNIS